MKVSIIAKLADLWVGFYWDRKHHRLYILPLPCLGVCLDWSKPEVREPGRVTMRTEAQRQLAAKRRYQSPWRP